MNAPAPQLASPSACYAAPSHGDSPSSTSTSGRCLKTLAQHPLRVGGRSLWLIVEIGIAAIDYARSVAFRSKRNRWQARGLWLQRACRRAMRIFNLRLQTSGPVPERGLLVSNHLSYLDILVLGATAPATFVAKREVKNWPIFGWFAALAGTVFVHRQKRTDTARSTGEIQAALEAGALVVLFPEGTSSGGDTVLPFKSALLESAAASRHPLTACCLQFDLEDGSVPDDVCYWRDMTLVPHLLNLLGKRGVSARVTFASVTERSTNRKELARQLHVEVLRLKSPNANTSTALAS